MAKRTYSPKTIKVLYGACGNQCAHPDCTHPIIAKQTAYSEAAVMGQIAHIYAAADNGPRGKAGLTQAERNAPANLVLLCGHHHTLVDKQWETYPAEMLFEWKRSHEAKFEEGTAEALRQQEALHRHGYFQSYSDQQIEADIERIRKGRYLHGFDAKNAAHALANRVRDAEYSGGSSLARAKALAWAARVLALDESDLARRLLAESRRLAPTSEGDLAEAFLLGGDKDQALARLIGKNTPAARSVALRVVTNAEKSEGAVAWVKGAGLSIEAFDSEGKLVHLINELTAGCWSEAISDASKVTEADFVETPTLLHAVAMCRLVAATPEQLRPAVIGQVPFELRGFPLHDDAKGVKARREAAVYFQKAADFSRSLGISSAASPDADYALWLRLRDPLEHDAAMAELRASMRDPEQRLRRLHMALHYDIAVDLAAVEQEIDQRAALSGKGTADEAFARFALAFTKKDPKGVADYIGRHREQLYTHLQKVAIQTIEVEMLARAKQVDAAKERLADAIANGLSKREQDQLGRMIEEAEGADPAAARKDLFDRTHSVTDLANLVDFLEEQEAWQELSPYAEQLFEMTHAVRDALRVAGVLDVTEQHSRLHAFLTEHRDLVDQSIGLKTMLAWSLYREGHFKAASALLNEIAANRDDHNDRALRVNLAIASGKWDDLVAFSTEQWNRRNVRTAPELLAAGQIAQAVGAPHAEDLVHAAAEKAADNPDVLAAAYFHAVSAGWDRSPVVGGWLSRAAELSGDDGPLRSVTMKELTDQKPAWDKREAEVWQNLTQGKLPTFGAAYMLNRQFIDFVLLQSLADLSESDPRKRGTVYAFSGARPSRSPHKPKAIALELGAILTLARTDLLPTVVRTYEKVVIPNSTLGWLYHERQKASFHQPSRIKESHFRKRLVAEGALNILPSRPLNAPLALEVGVDLAHLLLEAKARSETEVGVPRYVVRSAPVHRIGSLMEEEADLAAYSSYLCSCQGIVEKLRARGAITVEEAERALAYLALHERRWPSELAIADGATLYLDDLSTAYLQTTGMLDRLKRAGFTAYITEDADNEANRLIRYENLSQQQLDIIEAVRKTLAEGLESGRVRAVRAEAPGDEKTLKSHPTFGVLGVDEPVDALIVDDRFVNQHLFMDSNNRRTPILTTLDLLDDLADRAVITRKTMYAHRTHLRQAGFQLIPITEDELNHHLKDAPYADDKIAETAELRAIRESMLKARMIKLLQIPAEVPWLHQSMGAVIKAIKALWKEKTDPKEAAAYADWLLALVDLRGWAPSALPGNERNFALFAYAAHVESLVMSPDELSAEMRDAYHNWVDERVIKGVAATEPEMFDWIMRQIKELILRAADDAARELGGSDGQA